MELKDFLKNFAKFWPVLAIFTLAGGTAGLFYSNTQTPVYSTAVSVYFAPTNLKPGISLSSGEFTDSILAILTSKATELPAVKIIKVAPQILQFKFAAKTAPEVEKQAEDLPFKIETILAEFFEDDKVVVKPLNPQIEITESANLTLLNIIVGAALGLVVASTLASMVIYFRS